MFMCNSLIWRKVELEIATLARRKSDKRFAHYGIIGIVSIVSF